MRARLFPLILSALLAQACSSAPPPAPALASIAPQAPPAAQPRLPDVPVIDLDRATKSVEGVRKGRVALLTFWATWCEACQKEFAALNRLDEKTTGEKAVVIGVAVGEPSAKVRGFVADHGLRYAQLVDEEFHLTDAMGQKRLPATVIVGRSGEVVYRGGMLDAEALAAFREALKE